jgi:Complex I intermediate-associated protein 30 (CIA30)/NAD(P)H-binding
MSSPCFVPSVQLPSRRQRTPATFATRMSVPAKPPVRQPWPVGRFLRTVLWYSPLGALLRPPPAVGGTPVPPTGTAAAAAAAAAATPGPIKPRADMLVLVTGAAGATGRRVVRELLADGSRVRAVVRNREAAVAALAKVGVSAEESADRLELVVTDLYNLTEGLFDGVDAVIGCTGTRIGPAGDTPDRAMYMQGLKFFTPVVLDDSPANVELVGVLALAERAAARFASLSTEGRVAVPVLAFDDESFGTAWNSLDDVVMGGVSESRVVSEAGEFVFKGIVSADNGGGFASARSVNFPTPLNLGDYDGLRMRVKGDGNRYKIILRCDSKWCVTHSRNHPPHVHSLPAFRC